jgi:hypothetical protein
VPKLYTLLYRSARHSSVQIGKLEGNCTGKRTDWQVRIWQLEVTDGPSGRPEARVRAALLDRYEGTTKSRSTASTSPAHTPGCSVGGSQLVLEWPDCRPGPPVTTPPPTSWRGHLRGCSSQARHEHVPARRPPVGAGRRLAEHGGAARSELDAAARGIE